MLTLLLAVAAAVQSPGSSPEESRLIAGAITALRPRIVQPGEVRFRRIYFRTGRGMDGQEHVALCGQMLQDDPRAEAGWTMFIAIELGGEVSVMVGDRGFVNAAILCRPSTTDRWDYSRDFSALFSRELRAGQVAHQSEK